MLGRGCLDVVKALNVVKVLNVLGEICCVLAWRWTIYTLLELTV